MKKVICKNLIYYNDNIIFGENVLKKINLKTDMKNGNLFNAELDPLMIRLDL